MQGILVFASVMATLGLQIILESTRSLISDVSPSLLVYHVHAGVHFCSAFNLLLSITGYQHLH
jgi:hypothetical protein